MYNISIWSTHKVELLSCVLYQYWSSPLTNLFLTDMFLHAGISQIFDIVSITKQNIPSCSCMSYIFGLAATKCPSLNAEYLARINLALMANPVNNSFPEAFVVLTNPHLNISFFNVIFIWCLRLLMLWSYPVIQTKKKEKKS